MAQDIAQGTVHQLPDDLREALLADAAVLGLWQSITPLGRNEFICWVEDAKQAATRAAAHQAHRRRIARRQETPLLLARLHPPHR